MILKIVFFWRNLILSRLVREKRILSISRGKLEMRRGFLVWSRGGRVYFYYYVNKFENLYKVNYFLEFFYDKVFF